MKERSRKKYDDGFTLVEMIITIAIMAVLAGASITAVGMISSGNAKRAAAKFNNHLTTAQTETMMKKDQVFLYLFDDGGIKTVMSTHNYQSRAQLDSGITGGEAPDDVGGTGVKVVATAEDGSTYTLDSSKMIKIAFYKASGAYQYANTGSDADTRFFSEIKFSGRGNFKVTLVKMTGKHVVNK